MEKSYLKNLTPEQLKAATDISGPMMVIAGPGTGKTQVICARIAFILDNTDIQPQNILVLTFTESGTVAVRKRLHSFIGNDAYYVSIFTFHAFAESIIERYPDIFAKLGNNVVTDVEQITFLRKILDSLELTRLKVTDDAYYYLRDILRNISTLKREAVTPEQLKNLTKIEISDIQNAPENFNKKTQKLKTEPQSKIKSLEKNFELSEIYGKYQEMLRKENAHDYDDMIINVLDQIKNNDELKSDLQERYQYFLVDEYQDTNGAQNQIVESLALNEFNEPDLFVVGDDDQSIYRFQGASLSNIIHFQKKFPTTKIVLMTQSHRSTQKVLDAAMDVIRHNTERLVNVIPDINKDLVSKIESKKTSINLVNFDTSRQEYLWLAGEIQKLKMEGYKYSDMAIFFRNNTEVADISSFLQKQNIPVTSDKSSNILADTDIRNLITLIRCIAEPYDDRLIYAVLSQKWTGIDPVDILKLVSLRQKKRVSLVDLILDKENLIEAGIQKKNIDVRVKFSLFAENIDRESENNVTKVLTFIAQMNQLLQNESFAVFFDTLLKETKWIDLLFAHENKIEKLNRLSTLFDQIKKGGEKYTYEDFLTYINILQDYNLTIQEKNLELTSDSVHVMTAHKSKGLEYPIVFIPKCVDKYWGNPQSRNNLPLPENIVGDFRPSKDEKNEEERRLFYVALTRAKEKIYLSYSSQYDSDYGKKDTMPSMFVNEINKDLFTVISPEITISDEDIKNEILTSKKNLNEEIEGMKIEESNLVKDFLTDFKLNATALNNYLTCPRKFYYSNLLRIPELKRDSQSFGTAMHKALEVFFAKYIEEKVLPSKEFLIEKFHEAFTKEIVSKNAREKMIERGEKGLSGYYEQVIIPNSNKFYLYTELNFDKRNVYFDDFRITGKVDAIVAEDTDKKIVSVIDYKTGRVKSHGEIEKFSQNSEYELVPSPYYTQLMFYKLLTQQDKSWKYEVKSGILDFIEGRDGKYKQEEFVYKDEEMGAFKTLVKETMARIKDLDFHKIKQGKTCKKCPFNKICWGG